jgi:hypothetical protein
MMLCNMTVFTYHLIHVSIFESIKIMFSALKADGTEGLVYAETMSAMVLGSPIYSISRLLSKDLVVFAQWESDNALEHFLQKHPLGKKLSTSWYLKLEFVRQWGNISGFQIPKNIKQEPVEINPVVAVTLARMKFTQIPRFIRWGRPVEKLVRDHSGTCLSLASIRYPNLVSTFSIWKTQKEMTDMVQGHSNMPQPARHIDAMKERDRKDFHFEFTTLRFKVLGEFGSWKGKANFTTIKND